MSELGRNADASLAGMGQPESPRAAIRWPALGLLAVVHVAIAGICSPLAVRSGEWAVAGLDDPDCLVFVATGVIAVHQLILYPLWAAFGPGKFWRRFAIMASLNATLAIAQYVRGVWRGYHGTLVDGILSILACFSVATLGFWVVQRYSGRRIAVPGTVVARLDSRPFRFQFRLIHLLEGITLAACVLAFLRFHYPDGLPREWWQVLVRAAQGFLLAMLTLLPTVAIPWLMLARVRHGRVVILAAATSWAALDCALIWLMGYLGLRRYFPSPGELVLSAQCGASAAAILSSLVIRFCGYRIVRVERGRTSPS